MTAIWLIVCGLTLGGLLTLFKAKRIRHLPDISDEDFLRIYRLEFQNEDEAVLRERKYLGDILAIPFRKLSPEHTLKELEKHGGLLEYNVALGDLDNDLLHFLKKAGVSFKNYKPPQTVGGLIHEIIRLKEKEQQRS